MSPSRSYSDLATALSGGEPAPRIRWACFVCSRASSPISSPGILTRCARRDQRRVSRRCQDPFANKVEQLADVWAGLSIEDVFKVDLRDLTSMAAAVGWPAPAGGSYPVTPARSMVDTAPLRDLLARLLATDARNSRNQSESAGRLAARLWTASSYTTGQSVTWVQTRDDCSIETWSGRSAKASLADCRSIT